jgi:hypothetical protein
MNTTSFSKNGSTWCRSMFVALMSLGLFACGGGGGTPDTSTQAIQPTALAAARSVATFAKCPNGGNAVDSGIDANGNKVLDSGEVTNTQYVCSGGSGLNTLVLVSSEAAGTNCANGGSKVDAGLDANSNGKLDAAEITSTAYVCNGLNGSNGSNGTNGTNGTNGLNSLVSIVPEPAGQFCTYGGNKVSSGLDSNANGILDLAEVTASNYVCNGAPGLNGTNGTNGTGIAWVDVTGTSVQAVANTGYMADNAAQVTITLPASPAVGDVIQVSGVGAGGWKIVTNTTPAQLIASTYISAIQFAGTISGLQYEAIELQYVGHNTFTVLNYVGTNPTTLVTPSGYVYQGGLTWMPVSEMLLDNWTTANTHCTTATINGLTGWRLPTSAELSALYTSGAMNGQGWWTLNNIWSSTLLGTGYHTSVNLDNGFFGASLDTSNLYVTCVR